MVQFGSSTSFYLQEWVSDKVEEAIHRFPDDFRSRSHFVNCAVIKELRALGLIGKEVDVSW